MVKALPAVHMPQLPCCASKTTGMSPGRRLSDEPKLKTCEMLIKNATPRGERERKWGRAREKT